MSATLYLTTICLPLVTLLAIFGMRYYAQIQQANSLLNLLGRSDHHHRLAESSMTNAAQGLVAIHVRERLVEHDTVVLTRPQRGLGLGARRNPVHGRADESHPRSHETGKAGVFGNEQQPHGGLLLDVADHDLEVVRAHRDHGAGRFEVTWLRHRIAALADAGTDDHLGG